MGNVVRYKELRQPYAGADEDMVTASYVYDNRRRLIREVRALNYENSVAVDYEYDDLGKLVGKTTRNGGLNTTMAYNLQGWQTDMQVTDSGQPAVRYASALLLILSMERLRPATRVIFRNGHGGRVESPTKTRMPSPMIAIPA